MQNASQNEPLVEGNKSNKKVVGTEPKINLILKVNIKLYDKGSMENHISTFTNVINSKSHLESGSDFGLFSHLYQTYRQNFSDNDNGSGGTSFSLSTGLNYQDHWNWNRNRSGDDWFKFAVDGVAVVTVAILGIIGNMFSVWILTRSKMRSSISCLLIALAFADTVFTFMTILISGLPTVLTFYGVDISTSKIGMFTPYLYSIGITAHMASVYYTLAVTIERYLAVCHPLAARLICTCYRARFTSIVIAVLANVYNIPRWWEYTFKEIIIEETGVLHYFPVKTSIGENSCFEKFYLGLGYTIFCYLLPIVILIVFNSLIYRTIRRANQKRKTLSTSEENENSLEYMLVMVVSVFLVCHAPPLVNIFSKIVIGNYEIRRFDSIRNFMIIFNSSVNLVIYCMYGEKFRSVILEEFDQLRRRTWSKLYLIVSKKSRNLTSHI